MNILIDTCFWYAYYDAADDKHKAASELMDHIEKNTVIVPYPTLYETINTRFSKNKEWVDSFKNLLYNNSCQIIQDEEYKKTALELTFNYAIEAKRPMSLVDMLLRLMIDDVNLKIDAVVSFNKRDFIDLCNSKNIELLPLD